jgi:hypothetical protein
MRRTLVWLGALFALVAGLLVTASLVMSYLGYDASYNFGDAAKFEFVLVPVWQIGLAIGVVGALCLIASRRWHTQ